MIVVGKTFLEFFEGANKRGSDLFLTKEARA